MNYANNIEAFFLQDRFRYVAGGFVAVVAIFMLIGFAAFSWYVIEPDSLVITRVTQNDDGTEEVDELVNLSALIQDGSTEKVSMSALTIWSGGTDAVPTLDLDKATAQEDGVRFVDSLLILIPLWIIIMLVVVGLMVTNRLKLNTSLISLVFMALFLFLMTPTWEVLSILDFHGYEAFPDANPRTRTQYDAIVDNFNGFNSNSEQQILAGIMVIGILGLWIGRRMAESQMFRQEYLRDTQENMVKYFKDRSVLDYVVSIGLLVVTIVILDWFYPLASENASKFYQLTYTGLSEGILLALIALGLVLIYKATDVINFAHGEMMALGAYIFAHLLVEYDFALGWGILAAAAAMIIVGALVERLILRPLIGEPIISVIMVTIGLSNVIEAIVGISWKNKAVNWTDTSEKLNEGFLPLFRDFIPRDTGLFKELEGGSYFLFGDGRLPFPIQYEKFYLAIIVTVLIIGLTILFKYSKQGVAMRATADDQQAALSMGISVKRIFAIAWGIAALFAGIAGVLLGDIGTGANLDIPSTSLRAFPVIILGGLDSIAGAIIGGLIIGLLETYAVGYLDPWLGANVDFITSSTKDIVPYVVLLVVLMFRPYGLFGKEIIERV